MTCIDAVTLRQIARVLSETSHPEARQAFRRLKLAAMKQVERDAKFNNETPALCRRQAD
jgi:hypothetical protein